MCSYASNNSIEYDAQGAGVMSKGVVRINGDILTNDLPVYDGICIVAGEKHDIIRIKRHRNLFNNLIVDFTELVLA